MFWCLLHRAPIAFDLCCLLLLRANLSHSPHHASTSISQCTHGAREEDDATMKKYKKMEEKKASKKALVSLLSPSVCAVVWLCHAYALLLLRSGLFLGSPLSELHTQHRARDHKVLAIQEVEEEGDGRREFDHFSNLSLSKCLLWRSV